MVSVNQLSLYFLCDEFTILLDFLISQGRWWHYLISHRLWCEAPHQYETQLHWDILHGVKLRNIGRTVVKCIGRCPYDGLHGQAWCWKCPGHPDYTYIFMLSAK